MVVASLQTPEEAPYKINNRTHDIIVDVPALGETVQPGTITHFSWLNPEISHDLTIKLIHKATDTIHTVELNPDKIGTVKRVTINQPNKTHLYISVTAGMVNDKRVISIKSKMT
jgi:hypothetical protein